MARMEVDYKTLKREAQFNKFGSNSYEILEPEKNALL